VSIFLYIAAASCLFSLATLAWGCLLAWRRTRQSARRGQSRTPLSLTV